MSDEGARAELEVLRTALQAYGITTALIEDDLRAGTQVTHLLDLYRLYLEAAELTDHHREQRWHELDPGHMSSDACRLCEALQNLPAPLNRLRAHNTLEALIQDHARLLQIVANVHKAQVGTRLWREYQRLVGCNWRVDEVESFKLGDFLASNPLSSPDAIQFLLTCANKQETFQRRYTDTTLRWANDLELATWVDGERAINQEKLREEMGAMEDSKTDLFSLLTSPYCGFLKKDVEYSLNSLTLASGVLQSALLLQKSIDRLSKSIPSNLMVHSLRKFLSENQIADIQEAYNRASVQWRSVVLDHMQTFAVLGESHHVLQQMIDRVSETVAYLNDQLDKCVQFKRRQWNKFWLLDEDELLELIITPAATESVTPCLNKLFGGVSSITKSPSGDSLVGIRNATGETLTLSAIPTDTGCDILLRDLGSTVQDMMQRSLSAVSATLLKEAFQSSASFESALQDLIDTQPGQLVSVGLRILWTDWVEGSLGFNRPKSAPATRNAFVAHSNVSRLSHLTTPKPCSGLDEEDLSRSGRIPTLHGFRDTSRPGSAMEWGSRSRSPARSRPGSAAAVQLIKQQGQKANANIASQPRGSVKQGKEATENRIDMLIAYFMKTLQDKMRTPRRCLVENLIGEHMQLREQWIKNIRALRDPMDFSWRRQPRYYWDRDTQQCNVWIGDLPFVYGDEWMEAGPRLVHTPLSNRAFFGLATAVQGMSRIGTVVGPSGSGKKSIIKELGYMLGRWIVPYKCSPQWTAQHLCKVVEGVACSGLWAVLEDIHQISASLISEFCSLIRMIFDAMRTKSDVPVFSPLTPIKGLSLFATATCSPSEKGAPCWTGPYAPYHSNLLSAVYAPPPTSPPLSTHLRSQLQCNAVALPDMGTWMEIKIASAGFRQYKLLGRKLAILLELCQADLPSLKAGPVLGLMVISRAAVALATKGPEHEDLVFRKALKDTILPRLPPEDTQHFLTLCMNVFACDGKDESYYLQIQAKLSTVLQEKGLIRSDSFMRQCIQLYEITSNQPTIILTGAPSSGKTTTSNVLQATLNKVLNLQYREVRFVPKGVPSQEMFGFMDPQGGWCDGLFTTIWRQANPKVATNPGNSFGHGSQGPVRGYGYSAPPIHSAPPIPIRNLPGRPSTATPQTGSIRPSSANPQTRTLPRADRSLSLPPEGRAPTERTDVVTWIVCDGCMDCTWTESIESLWGQNQSLILPSLETLPQGKQVKLLFETHDVAHMSPTVVGLSGMLYFKPHDWNFMLTSQLGKTVPDATTRAEMSNLFHTHVEPFHSHLTKSCGLSLPITHCIRQTLTYMHGLSQQETSARVITTLSRSNRKGSGGFRDEASETMAFWFSLAWGFAGGLDIDQRRKANQYIQRFLDVPGMIFDYAIDAATGQWSPWSSTSLMGGSKNTSFLPTVDTHRMHCIFALVNHQGVSMLVSGDSGVGKSANARSLMEASYPIVLFTESSTSQEFRTWFWSQNGTKLAKGAKKGITFCIDDIHKPNVDAAGAQPIYDVVRSLIDSSPNAYTARSEDGSVLEEKLDEVQFVALTSIEGMGRLCPRLVARCVWFHMTQPSSTSVEHFAHAFLERGFPKISNSLRTALSKFTSDLWVSMRCSKRVRPYFCFGQLKSLMTGMLLAQPEDTNEDDLLVLWKHECQRVFGDRFGTLRECSNDFANFMKYISQEHPQLAQHPLDDALFFNRAVGTTKRPRYVKLSPDAATQSLQVMRAQYNQNENPSSDKLGICLTPVFVEDTLRIVRVLSMDKGSLVLMGDPGHGKHTVIDFAVYTAGVTSQPWSEAMEHAALAGDDDIFIYNLKLAYEATKKGHVAIILDANIIPSRWMQSIASLLSNGVLPGLLSPTSSAQSHMHFIIMAPAMDGKIIPQSIWNACDVFTMSSWQDPDYGAIWDLVLQSIDEDEYVLSSLKSVMISWHQFMESSFTKVYTTWSRETVHYSPATFIHFCTTFRRMYTNRIIAVPEYTQLLTTIIEGSENSSNPTLSAVLERATSEKKRFSSTQVTYSISDGVVASIFLCYASPLNSYGRKKMMQCFVPQFQEVLSDTASVSSPMSPAGRSVSPFTPKKHLDLAALQDAEAEKRWLKMDYLATRSEDSSALKPVLPEASVKTIWDVGALLLGGSYPLTAALDKWQDAGLPHGDHALGNALLIQYSHRPLLLMDPESIYRNWVNNIIPGMVLVDGKESSSYLKIQSAASYGDSLLLSGVDGRCAGRWVKFMTRQWENGPLHGLEGDAQCRLILACDAKKLSMDDFSGEIELVNCIFDQMATEETVGGLIADAVITAYPDTSVGKIYNALVEAKRKMKDIESLITLDVASLRTTVDMATASRGQMVGYAGATLQLLKAMSANNQERIASSDEFEDTLQQITKTQRNLRGEYKSASRHAAFLWSIMDHLPNLGQMPFDLSYTHFVRMVAHAISGPPRNSKDMDTVICRVVLQYLLRNAPDGLKIVIAFVFAFKADFAIRAPSSSVALAVLTGQPPPNHQEPADTLRPAWLKPEQWNVVSALEESIPGLRGLVDNFAKNWKWKPWYSQWTMGSKMDVLEKCVRLERLAFTRLLRPDRSHPAMLLFTHNFLTEKIGSQFKQDSMAEFAKGVCSDVTCKAPAIVILAPGVDCYDELYPLMFSKNPKSKKMDVPPVTVTINDMISDEGTHALQLLDKVLVTGGWIVFRNCGITCHDLLCRLASTLAEAKVHPEFRMVITTLYADIIPRALQAMSQVMQAPHPKTIKQQLTAQYKNLDPTTFDHLPGSEWKGVFFALGLFLGLVRERTAYGGLSFPSYNPHIVSPTGNDDLGQLLTYIVNKSAKSDTSKKPVIPWDAIRYMAGCLLAGGTIVDKHGLEIIDSYTEYILNSGVIQPGMNACFGYQIPFADTHEGHVEHIKGLPAVDRPECMGLHPNADHHLATTMAERLLTYSWPLFRADSIFMSTLMSHMESTTATVLHQLDCLAVQLPRGWSPSAIQKLCRVPELQARGPMATYIRQECQAYTDTASKIANQINQARDYLSGQVPIQTEGHDEVVEPLKLGKVPNSWQDLTFACTNIQQWIHGQQLRYAHLKSLSDKPWLIWLGCLTHPSRLLRALKEECTSARPGDPEWTIDNLEIRLQITKTDGPGGIMAKPKNGLVLFGLHADGFVWDSTAQVVREAPDAMADWQGCHTSELPPIMMTVSLARKAPTSSNRWMCPIYDTPKRDNLIARIDLPSVEDPSHWTIRGSCIYTLTPPLWPGHLQPVVSYTELHEGDVFRLSKVDQPLVTPRFEFGCGPYPVEALSFCLDANGHLLTLKDFVSHDHVHDSSHAIYAHVPGLTDVESSKKQVNAWSAVDVSLDALGNGVMEVSFFMKLSADHIHEDAHNAPFCVRIWDDNNQLILEYKAPREGVSSHDRVVEIGRLIRAAENDWEFHATCQGYCMDLKDVINMLCCPLKGMDQTLSRGQKYAITRSKPNTDTLYTEIHWMSSMDVEADVVVLCLNGQGMLDSDDDFMYYGTQDTGVQKRGAVRLFHASKFDVMLEIDLPVVASSVCAIQAYLMIHNADREGQSLADISKFQATLRNTPETEPVMASFALEHGKVGTTVEIGMFYRDPHSKWVFHATGAHSYHTARSLYMAYANPMPLPECRIRAPDCVELQDVQNLYVAMGWRRDGRRTSKPLPVEVVTFGVSKDGRCIESSDAKWHDRPGSADDAIAMVSDRDAMYMRDDAIVKVSLSDVEAHVKEIRLFLCIGTPDLTLEALRDVYVRVYDGQTSTLIQLDCEAMPSSAPAVELAKLVRHDGKRAQGWSFHALERPEPMLLKMLLKKIGMVTICD